MDHQNGAPDTLEKHQHEVCNAFARAAAAMRDAAHTAESFSNWFSRVNNTQNISVPPMFNSRPYSFPSNITAPQQQQQPYQPYDVAQPEQTSKKRKSMGDPEGKKKRQAKEKKPKDANAPKRPPSAYLLFQNQVRQEVKVEHPDLPYNQVLAEISKRWHNMTAEEKAPYVQATADSKVLYEKAKADYETHSPTTEQASKPVETKSKTSASAIPSVSKSAVQPDSSSDEDDSSSDSSSEVLTSSELGGEDLERTPEPLPQRKKVKMAKAPTAKTAKTPTPPLVKVPTPPLAKFDKKKDKEGKKKKKKQLDT